MTDELLKLKWNGHLSSFLQIFQSLRSKARYTDVTLACEGRLFTVHRLVLASCSQFFDHIFEQTPAENTVIILNEAKACDIEALLDYMYCGQVDVHQSNLASFIRTAKCLQIKGLATPEIADNFNKGKRSRDVDGDACPKKKRCEPPSVPPLPTGLYLRHSDENPSVANSPSPTSANSSLQHPRWVFQRSDLPNTTWSSSQAGAGDGEGKGEPFCSSSPYAEEVLVGDDCIPSKSSPHPQMEARRLTQHNYPLIPENKPPNSSYATTPELVYRGSGDYHDENVQQIKSEVKEEQKDAAVDESENFSNSDYSSQNYSYLNTYDREDSSECFSNSIPFRSNAFDNQPTGEAHNSFNQSRISYPLSLVKEVPATTSQATVSPKLMPYAKCSNCLTNNTKLWRRSIKGEIVCNACGLYYKLHGVNRPSHLFRNAPMTRRRNPRKKKKLYEEIAEGREHNVLEDKNDSLHNESGCDDSDTQDGLAVLNAALTLNSLFAKAKAQEAAAAAAAAKSQGDLRPPQGLSFTTTAERSTNSSITLAGSILQNDADPPSNADSRPPPPPLLKLHHTPRNSPPHLHPYPSFSHQKGGFVDDGRGRGGDETPVVST